MIKDEAVLLSIILIILCYSIFGNRIASNPQASIESCSMTYDEFSSTVRKAIRADRIDSLYYTQIANMNLQILIAKGCCKFSETCPALVSVN